MKKKLETKTVGRLMTATLTPLLLVGTASANGIADSTIGTGITKLFNDLSTYVIILSPIVAGVAAVYFIIRRSMSDEQDGKLWERRIKTAVVCGVGGALIGGVIKLIASYF